MGQTLLDDLPATLKEVDKLAQGATTIHFENRYRTKAGDYKVLSWVAQPNPRTGELYSIARDVTSLKKAEVEREDLRRKLEETLNKSKESERSFRELFENVPVGIVKLNSSFKFEAVNPAFLKVIGYSAEDLKKISMPDITHPDDIAGSKNAATKSFKDTDIVTNHVKRYIHKSGKIVSVRITSKAVSQLGSAVTEFFGIIEDITEVQELEKKIEIERAQNIHNSKLASLGEVSAGMAHEINNPLAIIKGSVSLLKKVKDDPEKFESKLKSINNSIERISKIVAGLRKFSRKTQNAPHHPHALSEIIRESLVMISSKALKHSVNIELDLQSESKTLCEELEIEQVVVNLVSNAIDAVSDLPDKWVKIFLFNINSEIVLQGQDSGGGISRELEEKLFQPFFTTKTVGHGTGLGLSISKGILDQHHASIVINRKYKNTCFEIRFEIFDEV